MFETKKLLKKGIAVFLAFLILGTSVLPEMSAHASTGTITYHSPSALTDSHGTKFSKYKVNGIDAWCIESKKDTPRTGFVVEITESTNENLRKVLWYGCKGPGAILADNNDGWMQTAQAASIAYCGETVNNTNYRAWYNRVITMASPPAGFKVYVADPTISQDYQDLAYFVYNPSGELKLKKTSSNTIDSSVSSYYSLSGAVYGVYSNSSCTTKVATLTTGSDGVSNTVTLNAGTYYVKEITSPKGHILNNAVYTTTVTSGGTTSLSVSDAPYGLTQIIKKSANPDLTDGNSCYSLEGAEYTVYSDEACTNSVMTLITDENAKTEVKYIAAGKYYVKETKAPKGYELDPKRHDLIVTAGNLTTLNVSDIPGNDPISIKLTKVNPGNAYVTHVPSLAGAQFTVKYYNGFYEEDNLPSEATRTWVIETKEAMVGTQIVYTASLTDTHKVSGDDYYYVDGNPQPILPLGTVSIEETKPAPGYTLTGGYLKPANSDKTFEGKYVTQITSSTSGDIALVGGNEFSIANYVLYGGIAVQKYDSETNSSQGSASLAGAKFTIKSLNEGTITVNGKTYEKGEVITTLVTNADGYAATTKDFLPYGDYEVEEVEAPAGYQLAGTNIKQTVTVAKENTLTVASATADNIIRGGLSVQKVDADTNSAIPQGSATLEGAEIAIINANESDVYVNGKLYGKGETVMTISTDENGFAQTGSAVLPYGTYEIKEVKAPKGYQLSGKNLKQIVTVSTHNTLVTLKDISDEVIRGGIAVQKYDYQTISSHAQGAATLKGAEFTIRSLNQNDVVVDGKTFSYGEDILVFTTDKEGYASTAKDLLPFGEYEIEETKAPKGYTLIGENIKQRVTVSKQDTVVELNTENTVTKDRVIRGDFKFHKAEYYSGRSMANVEFKITSQTTGESYVVKTDENGYYSSKSDYVSHAAKNGLWFGLDENGDSVTVDDSVGALPFDKYTIEELRCDANRMTDLYSGEFEIKEDASVVDLGIIFNYERKIFTAAKDSETNSNFSYPDEKVTIIDTVNYQGLIVGEEYTMKGVLMNQDTNEAILDKEGKKITASTTFVPTQREGSIDVNFTFEGSELAGVTAVVFEKLYDSNNDLMAEHQDLRDVAQTIYFPAIKTSLLDKEGYNVIIAGPTTLIDTVTYVGLEVGKEYTVLGVLMDQETGKAVLDKDGKEITSSAKFVAETKNGTVDVSFEFDATHLAGKTLVAFEKLLFDEIEYAAHEDLRDAAQTVYIPKISTSASDKEDGDKNFVSDEKVTIVDKVSYHNLTVGETYIVKGVLMDKTTGKPLLINGKEITVSKEFKAKETDGEVELEFTFDASELGLKTIVVFEELYQFTKKDNNEEERLIAVHKDLEDAEQTVSFSEKPKKVESDNPETGDTRKVLPAIIMFVGSFGVMCGLYLYDKKKKNSVE